MSEPLRSAQPGRPVVVVGGLILSTLFGAFVGDRIEARFGSVLGGFCSALLWLVITSAFGDASSAIARRRARPPVISGRWRPGIATAGLIERVGLPVVGLTVASMWVIAVGDQAWLVDACRYAKGHDGSLSVDLVRRTIYQAGPIAIPAALLVSVLLVTWLWNGLALLPEPARQLWRDASAVKHTGPLSTPVHLATVVIEGIVRFAFWLLGGAVALWLATAVFVIACLLPMEAATNAPWAPFLAYAGFVCAVAYASGRIVQTPTTHGFDEFGLALLGLAAISVVMAMLGGSDQSFC